MCTLDQGVLTGFHERLMREKEQLRKKEEQLREKQLFLLRPQKEIPPSSGRLGPTAGETPLSLVLQERGSLSRSLKRGETRAWADNYQQIDRADLTSLQALQDCWDYDTAREIYGWRLSLVDCTSTAHFDTVSGTSGASLCMFSNINVHAGTRYTKGAEKTLPWFGAGSPLSLVAG